MSTWKGPSAEVRWGYHRAATLGPWTITFGSGTTTVTADVIAADAFKVSQQPLTFSVPRPNGSAPWRWPVVSLQISGQTLTASLGPQE